MNCHELHPCPDCPGPATPKIQTQEFVTVQREHPELRKAAQQAAPDPRNMIIIQPQDLQLIQSRKVSRFNFLNFVMTQIKLLQSRQTEERPIAQP